MTGAIWASVGLLAQLGAATIDIELTDSTAVVDARYEISDATDTVRVVVMRIAGQQLEWLDGPVFRPLEGLYESTVPAGATRVRVRYEVTGGLDRIPLPVPGIPLAPTADAVSIRVTGAAPLRPDDTFPRFTLDGAGMIARPSSVPSFVRVQGGNRLFTNSVADGVVLAIMMLAVVVGLWREWSRRRPART